VPDMLLITNPAAGRDATVRARQVAAAVAATGATADVAVTTGPGDATRLAAEAIAAGVRHLVAVGGDGTVNEVVNAMVDLEAGTAVVADLKLGLVAAGTGSDFARTFGLDRAVAAAARHLTGGTVMPIDIGRIACTGFDGAPLVRAFANIADIGWAADVTRRAARMPRFVGRARYVVAGVASSRAMRPVPVRVEMDHTTREDEVCQVLVANAQFFGAGLRVAPRALPDDGRLNVQTWATGPVDVVRELPRVRVGEHLDRPDIREWQSRRVVVTPAGAPMPIEVDGEPIGTTPATIDLLPGVIGLSL